MGSVYALIEVEDTTDKEFVVPDTQTEEGITVDWTMTKKCTVRNEGQTSSMPTTLTAAAGEAIVMSVDPLVDPGPPALVVASLGDVNIGAMAPEITRNVSEVTLSISSDQEPYATDNDSEKFELHAYSGGSWQLISIFDLEQDELSQGTYTLEHSDILSAELLALVNNSPSTDLIIDDVDMAYYIETEEEEVVGTGSIGIPIGESSVEANLPSDNTSLDCVFDTTEYVLSTDSTEAVVYFSESRSPFASDPYGYSGDREEIVAATSSPEEAGVTDTERFHIRLIGEEATQCIADSGMVGSTGLGAKPRVLLDWHWDSITTETCNEENENFVYCDPTQLTASIIKRLEEIRQFAEENDLSDITKVMELRDMQGFKAYLIEDSYTQDFRNDFVDFYGNMFLVDEMTNEEHPWGQYLLDQEKLVFETEVARFDTDPDEPGLVGAGLHDIYIDLEFDQDQFEFFYIEPNPDGPDTVDLLATMTIYITKMSDPLIQTPFYYLPFNGDVGRVDGVLERDDYGVAFDNLTEDLVVVGDLEGYTTESPTGSTGRKLVQTENISDFTYTNIDNRGMLLQVEASQNEIKFSPSIATPVLAEIIAADLKAEAFYWLSSGGTVYSGPGTLASWNGVGSSMRMEDVCTDFQDNKLKKSIPDMPGDGCASGVPGSYGFSYDPAPSGEKLYLETVFYAPVQASVHLKKSCEEGSNFYAPGEGAIQKTEMTTTPISLSLENLETRAVSMDSVLKLIGDSYVCVSQSEDNQYYNFWWNPQKVLGDLDQAKAEIENWPSLECDNVPPSE
jgi:hypothetical protein